MAETPKGSNSPMTVRSPTVRELQSRMSQLVEKHHKNEELRRSIGIGPSDDFLNNFEATPSIDSLADDQNLAFSPQTSADVLGVGDGDSEEIQALSRQIANQRNLTFALELDNKKLNVLNNKQKQKLEKLQKEKQKLEKKEIETNSQLDSVTQERDALEEKVRQLEEVAAAAQTVVVKEETQKDEIEKQNEHLRKVTQERDELEQKLEEALKENTIEPIVASLSEENFDDTQLETIKQLNEQNEDIKKQLEEITNRYILLTHDHMEACSLLDTEKYNCHLWRSRVTDLETRVTGNTPPPDFNERLSIALRHEESLAKQQLVLQKQREELRNKVDALEKSNFRLKTLLLSQRLDNSIESVEGKEEIESLLKDVEEEKVQKRSSRSSTPLIPRKTEPDATADSENNDDDVISIDYILRERISDLTAEISSMKLQISAQKKQNQSLLTDLEQERELTRQLSQQADEIPKYITYLHEHRKTFKEQLAAKDEELQNMVRLLSDAAARTTSSMNNKDYISNNNNNNNNCNNNNSSDSDMIDNSNNNNSNNSNSNDKDADRPTIESIMNSTSITSVQKPEKKKKSEEVKEEEFNKTLQKASSEYTDDTRISNTSDHFRAVNFPACGSCDGQVTYKF